LNNQVRILIDPFSLRERGIPQSSLVENVNLAEMDQIVKEMVEPGVKVIWH
jgi:hypothetical protein